MCKPTRKQPNTTHIPNNKNKPSRAHVLNYSADRQKTGLEELKRTTAHEPNYDKLMQYRIDILNREGIKLQDMKDVVQKMEPQPGRIP